VTLRLVTPAPAGAVLDLYAASVPMKPINVKAAILQLARSENFAFYAGEAPIAAALLYPLPAEIPGERLVELAFVCRPELSRHMLAFIRLAHLMRARLAKDALLRVRAHVRRDPRPGHRLAALLGMTLVGRFGAFARYEVEGSNERFRQRGAVALLGA
jgi:hypothetical protein